MKSFFQDIFAVWRRESRNVIADKGVMIFLFFVPLFYPIVYALIYNPELVRDVPVVVVDNSRSTKSRSLVRKIDGSESAKVIGYASDMAEARECMAEKKSYGIVLIERDFDEKIGRGERGDVTLFCDMSLLIRYKSMLMALTEATFDLGSDVQVESISSKGADAPKLPAKIDSTYYPLGNPEQGFATFLLPGILVLVMQQTLLLTLGMMGGAERERRLRFQDKGKGIFAEIFGKIFTYVFLYVAQLVYLFFLAPMIFRYPQIGSVSDIILLSLPFAIGVILLGLTIQAFIKERESSFIFIVFTSILLLFLSGISWPLFEMNDFFQFLGGLFPSTWAMQAFVRINANAADLTDVGLEYRMLWLCALLYFATTYIVMRYRRAHDK